MTAREIEKDDLLLTPSEYVWVSTLPALPWALKPVFGLVSDAVPIYGQRRKPYLVICSLLCGLGFLRLGSAVSMSAGRLQSG